jgi:hypothetical protein
MIMTPIVAETAQLAAQLTAVARDLSSEMSKGDPSLTGLKQAKRETEVKNEWSYTSLPPTFLHCMPRDDCTRSDGGSWLRDFPPALQIAVGLGPASWRQWRTEGGLGASNPPKFRS